MPYELQIILVFSALVALSFISFGILKNVIAYAKMLFGFGPLSNIEYAKEEDICTGKNEIHEWRPFTLVIVDYKTVNSPDPQREKEESKLCIKCGYLIGTQIKLKEVALKEAIERITFQENMNLQQEELITEGKEFMEKFMNDEFEKLSRKYPEFNDVELAYEIFTKGAKANEDCAEAARAFVNDRAQKKFKQLLLGMFENAGSVDIGHP